MNKNLPAPFPYIRVSDHNPAIRLFGKRFISEQTVLEFMTEFLALVFFDKRIGDGETNSEPLPAFEELKAWSRADGKVHEKKLKYKPPVKLNLKLFAFLGSSRVDTRHETHKQQYQRLAEKLEREIINCTGDAEKAREWIEELLRGFQGAGFNRTWCAQTFFPVTTKLLTQETIWNETVALREPVSSWMESIVRFHKYYSVSKHRFMARGGELLYLQLCNALTVEEDAIKTFAGLMGFSSFEADPRWLHRSLQEGLRKLTGQYTGELDQLVDCIELLDKDTHELTNNNADWLTCEWCPRDSWREGYLFAVEINRLLYAVLDPVERLQLFTTGCALQVLRSLCAQSVRYSSSLNEAATGGGLGYAWLFSPPFSPTKLHRRHSHFNLQSIQVLIQQALLHEKLQEYAAQDPKKGKDALYREADTKYGHKLFLSLGKRLGIIGPQKGSGARFIMTDSVLRYLVLVLVPPGSSCTYDDFLHRLYLHYGIAVEGDMMADALAWSGNSLIAASGDSWLAEMLRAGGFLTELSDACSIVHNHFGNNDSI